MVTLLQAGKKKRAGKGREDRAGGDKGKGKGGQNPKAKSRGVKKSIRKGK